MIRFLLLIAVVLAAGPALLACGDDDDSGLPNVPPATEYKLSSATEYYENIQKVNGDAAAEVRRITAESEGSERYESAASVFLTLADEAEEFNGSLETVGAHEAYILTARLISETLTALAAGDEPSSEMLPLPSLIDDFEFVCQDFVDVARTIFAEGRDLDCTYGSTLLE